MPRFLKIVRSEAVEGLQHPHVCFQPRQLTEDPACKLRLRRKFNHFRAHALQAVNRAARSVARWLPASGRLCTIDRAFDPPKHGALRTRLCTKGACWAEIAVKAVEGEDGICRRELGMSSHPTVHLRSRSAPLYAAEVQLGVVLIHGYRDTIAIAPT